jgi:hypothetical protein
MKKLSVAAGFVAVFLVAGVARASWITTGAGGKEVE